MLYQPCNDVLNKFWKPQVCLITVCLELVKTWIVLLRMTSSAQLKLVTKYFHFLPIMSLPYILSASLYWVFLTKNHRFSGPDYRGASMEIYCPWSRRSAATTGGATIAARAGQAAYATRRTVQDQRLLRKRTTTNPPLPDPSLLKLAHHLWTIAPGQDDGCTATHMTDCLLSPYSVSCQYLQLAAS